MVKTKAKKKAAKPKGVKRKAAKPPVTPQRITEMAWGLGRC